MFLIAFCRKLLSSTLVFAFLTYIVPSLSLFVVLGKGQNYWEEENVSEEMPACRQMFNIFHPFDPVAYRYVLHFKFFF